MREEMEMTKLFTDGMVKTKDGREFTKLIGGFGNGKPSITDKQIAELLNYKKGARQVRVQINNNIKHFENEHLMDLKGVHEKDTLYETLETLGYTKSSITQADNIYILSQAGFLLYLKFAEGDNAVELYKDFIEDYFKIKADNIKMKSALEDELKELENEKAMAYGKLIMQKDEIQRAELAQELENIEERVRKLSSAIDNKKLSEALLKQSKLSESKELYSTQAEFGDKFNNKIGSKTVGKLLKVCGLAKRSKKGRTIPYQTIVPEYAYNNLDDTNKEKEYDVSYVWNYNKCVKAIDKWLKDHELLEKFYSITDKDILEAYIHSLYCKFVLDGDIDDYEEQATMEF